MPAIKEGLRNEEEWTEQLTKVRELLLEVFRQQPEVFFTRLELLRILAKHPKVEMLWWHKVYLKLFGPLVASWNYPPSFIEAFDQLLEEGIVIVEKGLYGFAPVNTDHVLD